VDFVDKLGCRFRALVSSGGDNGVEKLYTFLGPSIMFDQRKIDVEGMEEGRIY
jgi:hypothetical protein